MTPAVEGSAAVKKDAGGAASMIDDLVALMKAREVRDEERAERQVARTVERKERDAERLERKAAEKLAKAAAEKAVRAEEMREFAKTFRGDG